MKITLNFSDVPTDTQQQVLAYFSVALPDIEISHNAKPVIPTVFDKLSDNQAIVIADSERKIVMRITQTGENTADGVVLGYLKEGWDYENTLPEIDPNGTGFSSAGHEWKVDDLNKWGARCYKYVAGGVIPFGANNWCGKKP